LHARLTCARIYLHVRFLWLVGDRLGDVQSVWGNPPRAVRWSSFLVP